MKKRERGLSANKSSNAKEISKSKAARDWIPVAISLASLAVALMTPYFNFFLRADNVGLVISEAGFGLAEENGVGRVIGDPSIALINSGNRSAAITYLNLYGREVGTNGAERCASSEEIVTSGRSPLSPFVLKANDISVVTLKVGDRDHEPLTFPWNDRVGKKFIFCLQIRIATPDSETAVIELPAFGFEIEEEGKNSTATFNDAPITIHKSRALF